MSGLVDYILVRHGLSWGNIAFEYREKGLFPEFIEKVCSIPTAEWPLTDEGERQAMMAGEWLREFGPRHYDQYFVSDFLRTCHTAALLQLPDATWWKTHRLREQNFGTGDVMNAMAKDALLHDINAFLEQKQEWQFDYAALGGESFGQMFDRAGDHLADLMRYGKECAINVTSERFIWANRLRVERLTEEQFGQIYCSEREEDKIHNCQIIWYTKRDPLTQEAQPGPFRWMKSICPTDLSLSENEWRPIIRPEFSNEDLLAEVEEKKAKYMLALPA